MLALAIALLCATLLVLVERHVAPLVREWLALRYPKPVVSQSVQIPIDLIAWANGFSAQWAIDDARNFLLEEFERTHDWDQVRNAARERMR
jgi:hypothetical protein